jgi:membrane protein
MERNVADMAGSGDGLTANEIRASEAELSPSYGAAPMAPQKRHTLRGQERWLLEEEHRLLEKGLHAAGWVKASSAGACLTRLNAVDFMNSSMQFAALAVLCLFPFVITVSAEGGGDARHALTARMGLNQQAAHDVNHLMSSGSHTVSDLSFIGAALVLLGALGIASTLQLWYQRVYDQPPAHKWTRQLADRLLWLVGLVGYLILQDYCWTQLDHVGGARVPFYLVTFGLAVPFYWWTIHVLLLGKMPWRPLFPAAVATAVCVTGLGIFSALLFSGQIVSSDRDYGSIGVVMVVLSYLIGFGVCLHLGAVIGRMWNERRHPPSPEALQPSAE